MLQDEKAPNGSILVEVVLNRLYTTAIETLFSTFHCKCTLKKAHFVMTYGMWKEFAKFTCFFLEGKQKEEREENIWKGHAVYSSTRLAVCMAHQRQESMATASERNDRSG